MIKKIVFFLLFLLALIVVTYNISVSYVDHQLESENDLLMQRPVYDLCKKVWSSRGIYQTVAEQNSIQSLQSAFTSGYKGVEVDLFYDVKTDRFIISHDRPKKLANGELVYTKKDNEILTLEKLFKHVGKGNYFWLDYKNLGRISKQQTATAIERLLTITVFDPSLRQRIYIEGSNPLLLSRYTDAGFRTIFGIHPPADNHWLASVGVNIFKLAYYFNNITVLAMNSSWDGELIYGENTISLLKGLPVFLFHVPIDEESITTFMKMPTVKVVLTLARTNLNRAYLNNCGSEHSSN